MQISAFDRLLWAAGFAEQIVLLTILILLRRARTFPIFTALVAFSFSETVILSLVYTHASHHAYYGTYWLLAVADAALQLGLVYEIASHVFAPLGRWAPDVRQSFLRLTSASIVIAAALATLCAPVKVYPLERIIVRGSLFSSVLMTELFVGLVVLSSMAGLPWMTHVARIAQGAGAYAFISVLSDTCSTWLRWGRNATEMHVLTQARIVTYLVALAYWIVTLWQEAPHPRRMPEAARVQFFQLNRQLEYDLGRIRGWRKV